MTARTKPTLKQERFARAYVVEGNATEAAVQAGYNVKSREVAAQIGKENIRNPQVQHAIMGWRERLEAAVLPSLDVIEEIRDKAEDQRVRLAASRDLLNRAGIGKQMERTTNVVAVFSQMDESVLLEKMTQLALRNSANISNKTNDVSPNIDCATQEKTQGVVGSDSPAP